MSEYKKGKYSFSLAPALVLVGKEIVEERKNQVEGFIRELEDYNIILRDLAEEEVSLDLRNELLNIAMYISENAEIYNEFYEKKQLPLNKIAKVVLKPRQFLQKWREYIIVYSLILGNYNFFACTSFSYVLLRLRLLSAFARTAPVPKGYKRAVLVFDGAMSQPVVCVNGKEAGKWAYGYNAFRIDITPFIKFGKSNLIEVHLNNVEESSRWYPGGGLYRPVSVELYGNENFSTWDTFVRTLKADKQEAEVEVNALLEGKTGKSGKTVIALLDEAGEKVAEQTVTGANPEIKTTLKVANPHLWSPESPYLYQVKLTRYEGKKVADVQTLKTGIRTIAVSKDYGFQLNGVTRKAEGRLSAPRPRSIGCSREQGSSYPSDQDDEADGLRRHPYCPQHAFYHADGTLRFPRYDGHGREFRYVDLS